MLLIALTAGNALTAPSSARAQDTAAVTSFYTFPAASIAVNGSYPSGGLVKGLDGNFYGISLSPNAYGQVYQLTPTGQFSVFYQFQGGAAGSSPANLIAGIGGNLYGTASGGANNNGLLFQISATGAFTDLHDFNTAIDGNEPNSLVQTSDGSFFGTTYTGGPNNSTGTIYTINPAGKETVFTAGAAYPGTLIVGKDGNLYGTTYGDYLYYETAYSTDATVFQITPTGTYTTIASLPINTLELGPVSLIQGSDGNFYGTTGASNDSYYNHLYSDGTIFRVTPDGAYTNLHTFDITDGYGPVSLTEGSNGIFYGVTYGGGFNDTPTTYYGTGYTNEGNGTLFQITSDGAFTSLYSFTGGADGIYPNGPLLAVGDGTFYSTASQGGDVSTSSPDVSGYGLVYQLTLVPHPSFFTGQVLLQNNVYYLSFASGNYFGYYSFLPDPDYIYHFDLGYEYVIDSNDGQGDIYLYDFASSGFFYTGPNFPFPYLYDFNLKTIVYYFPDPDNAGHYNLYGTRYFYDFATNEIIAK